MERDDTLGASALNAMKYSDVPVTIAPPMTHGDFSAILRFSSPIWSER